MDAVTLARIQFAFTIGFHYIFPPLTIGLAWIIVWMMRKDMNLARFWTKILAITFAIGVATGITMEFQFGTNWAKYSRFVGDIFGVPLAAEGILAFFLESTFIAVLIYGWGRFSKKTLLFSAIMVAIGSTLSGFWIIVANSWQQTPAGYHIVNGRAELTNFWEAVFNPSTLPRYLHTIDGALITGAFFVLGVSAWFLIRKQHLEFAKKTMKIALVFGFIASALQLPLGHYHAVQVAHTQPEKLAAIEGVMETVKGAPALIFGIPDSENETIRAAIKIPKLLSLMAFGDINAEVKGLKDFPKDEWPPLALTFYPFHLMVAMGIYFIALTTLGLFLSWRKNLFENAFFLKLALFSIPIPFVANELGWISAEVGRQPWIVYKILRTSEAISTSVPASQILFSLITFAIIYSLLFVAWFSLIRREIRRGPSKEAI